MGLELHLLHYHKVKREYMSYFKIHKPSASLLPLPSVKQFLSPWDPKGYATWPITDDLITDIFEEFSKCTQIHESEDYLRTITCQLNAVLGDIYHTLVYLASQVAPSLLTIPTRLRKKL